MVTEYFSEMIVPDPVYLLVNREAVQVEGEKSIILDPHFTLKEEIKDGGILSLALLVYLQERGAYIYLDSKNDLVNTVGVFRQVSQLISFLESHPDIKWIILNKIPGENDDGHLIRSAHFINQIRKRMADGT